MFKFLGIFIQGILVGIFTNVIGLEPFSVEWWLAVIVLNILATPITNKITEEIE